METKREAIVLESERSPRHNEVVVLPLSPRHWKNVTAGTQRALEQCGSGGRVRGADGRGLRLSQGRAVSAQKPDKAGLGTKRV